MSALTFRTATGHQFFQIRIARAEDSHTLNGSIRPVFSGKIAANYLDGDEPWGRTRQFTTPIMEREHARQLETLLLIPGVATVEGDIWDRRTSVFVSSVSKGERAGGAGQVAVQFTLVEAEPTRDGRALVLLDAPNGVGFSDLTVSRDDAALAVDEDGIYQSFAADAIRLPHFVGGVAYALHEPGSENEALHSILAGTLGGTTITGWTQAGLNDFDVELVASLKGDEGGAQAGLVEDLNGERSFIQQDISGFPANTTFTLSLEVEEIVNPTSISGMSVSGAALDTFTSADSIPDGFTGRHTLTFTTNASGGTVSLRIGAGVSTTRSVDRFRFSRPQIEEGEVASSYIATTTASVERDDDAWLLATAITPQQLGSGAVFYADYINLGGHQTGNPRIVGIGFPGDTTVPDDALYFNAPSGIPQFIAQRGGVVFNVAGSAQPDLGARVRLVGRLEESGTQYVLRFFRRFDDADWTDEGTSDPFDLWSEWTAGNIVVGSRGDGTSGGRYGFSRLALFDRTLTTEEVEDRFHV